MSYEYNIWEAGANDGSFTMYGASAQLVITMKGGTVNGFTLVNHT